ncbi:MULTISPECIES: hypothetical protein [unclassified Moorena]|uniref:hypothetical protein n=1 Tax=unclassified Moorena TaxID=2683338 RepID=UPI0013FFBD1B|nr:MULTISPECIES: hypothetical protein [unclassified Moorena]NEO12077.1 hypothetical protein [Moorena sp. SIO3E8]NEP98192.1 hypothetical protein [Moorena sp. SIO3F7]
MNWREYIDSNPNILLGKPVLAHVFEIGEEEDFDEEIILTRENLALMNFRHGTFRQCQTWCRYLNRNDSAPP